MRKEKQVASNVVKVDSIGHSKITSGKKKMYKVVAKEFVYRYEHAPTLAASYVHNAEFTSEELVELRWFIRQEFINQNYEFVTQTSDNLKEIID